MSQSADVRESVGRRIELELGLELELELELKLELELAYQDKRLRVGCAKGLGEESVIAKLCVS